MESLPVNSDTKDNNKSLTSLPSTIKEYLEDSYKFHLNKAKLLAIEDFPKEPNSHALIFDRTIFHPQGGGQPSDVGVIVNNGVNFEIGSVAYDRERDVVLHKVSKENANLLNLFDEFEMSINEEKRRLSARLHSAGHLLDIAVQKLGLNLIPGKGYHFADGPYVEYNGNIDKTKIAELTGQIEKVSNEIIESSENEDLTLSKFYDYEDGLKVFNSVPNYLPAGKPFRWVKLLNYDLGCPCGGTHVKHVKDIMKMKINKITNKGKLVRVSYSLLL